MAPRSPPSVAMRLLPWCTMNNEMEESSVFDILEDALELPPAERPAFLQRCCAGAPELRRRLQDLLAADEQSGDFLRVPGARPLPGQIGGYPVLGELGRGASGVVYLAEDGELRRRIAIKTFPPGWGGNEARKRRLREEALALASVTQPNVAHVYSFEETAEASSTGDSSTGPFITMEFVDGETLAERLRGAALGLPEALDIGRQIAAGLEAAHRVGIVHRDLKPENVKITPDGWVKILDFGLARSMVGHTPDATVTAAFQGTPGYMSPEQIEGGPVEASADVWSLGCLLFECLHGHPAIEGESLTALIENTREGLVAWPQSTDTRRAEGLAVSSTSWVRLQTLLRTCLVRDARARTITAGQIRRALDEELLRLRSASLFAASPAAAHCGRLPARRGEFVGRTSTLEELAKAVEPARLVTVSGPGGAGKTRTVVELSHRIADRYPGGAWFVELSEIDAEEASPVRIAETLVRALEVREVTDHGPEHAVSEHLGGRAALLVLDNCEHLLDTVVQMVSRLIETAPSVSFVATSREPLRLPEERLFLLGSLELPRESEPEGRTRRSEAVQLFLQRAGAHDPAFRSDDQDLARVARICRRLDGLPLAIELAAAKTRALSLRELDARIEQDVRVLDTRGSLGADRHRSLDALIEWSYRLLSPSEQGVLRALSVFRGSWGLSAAEAVATGPEVPVWKVCSILGSLVEKCLVEADTSVTPVRYRLLETVRAFSELRRSVLPEEPAIEDALVGFFVSDVQPRTAESGWTDGGWVARTNPDHANIEHAFDLALERRHLGRTLVLGVALTRRAISFGYWRSGLETFDRVRRLLAEEATIAGDRAPSGRDRREMDEEAEIGRFRVQLLANAALCAVSVDDHARADALVAEGICVAESMEDKGIWARIYSAAGVVAYYKARLDEADGWLEKAETLHRGLDEAGLAANLAERGRIRSVSGQHDGATRYYEEALSLLRRVGDQPAIARVLVNLGRTAGLLGDPKKARELLEEALDAHRGVGDAPWMAVCWINLGDVARADGHDLPRALRCYRESARIHLRSGGKSGLCSALIGVAQILAEMGRDGEAARVLAGVRAAYHAHDLVLYDATDKPMIELRGILEAQMEKAAFEAAWRAGERQSLADVMEFVERATQDR